MPDVHRLSSLEPDFDHRLERLLAWEASTDDRLLNSVKQILSDVKRRGDLALLEYTRQFDRIEAHTIADLDVPASRMKLALDRIPGEQRRALDVAADRLRAYAERQKISSWDFTEADGTLLGQRVTSLDRVGLYVPGGQAAYPSSVLMNAIPAKVAGVAELIMVVPAPEGVLNDLVLAAAAITDIDRVVTIGGAQAIAALAYGTATIPAVDKVVGPGNIYVATAKALVFGRVGIDMIAGPSEILVVCDGKTDPDWIAMDLFSQAEHDADAQSILLCPDLDYLDRVVDCMDGLLTQMPRADVIRASLRNRGALIRVRDMDEAVEIANRIAPEHLELSVEQPELLLPKIRHAGAIFLGRYTAEAVGDYCAGPNHVLPTARTARFSSPLGVYDFQKRSSVIGCSAAGASQLGEIAAVLAHGEGLVAHARSAGFRIK